ncbi:probable LRR receptor-like serine/threonine-protein kinase At1g06840 isoform X2 [Olea europaea var. sylvestris]|uniref:probable LRR receptor-like serine/threonine-protein kinase At1g06840 isoform X2 n=1 Tax=Olea europaea var. sylvestris TaxID=158386 RepID=UPI000C1D3342|nr:probable LRR receptor-like serine/threonine-protein kinase At1g06840 isoform X2 [Olea europaea var. sylvestris]
MNIAVKVFDDLGKMGTSGRYQPRFVKLGLTLILYLCWSLLLTGADRQKTHPAEVNALRAIRESLTDPFQNLKNWKRGDPCTSSWTGIFCYNITPDDGFLHVRELSLLNMNLHGNLSPELVHLSHMKIMDFMWNNISGTIPKQIGNITTLELLLLNGNKLTGPLPDEIGNLRNLDRLQIDENQISGSIPKSLANLNKAMHFHMNNNSLSGKIPPELSRLPQLVHLLLDNNNLSGHLPPELSEMPSQLDNNNFEGSTIPPSYGNSSTLTKLSLRNCSLQGQIPNWSNMTNIAYIDLSLNKLSGTIPTGVLPEIMTTIDLSNNNLNGIIPASFSRLPLLQKLSLANNSLSGSVPSTIWQNRALNQSDTLLLDFRNNKFLNISGSLVLPPNVTVSLQGNVVCSKGDLIQFCGSYKEEFNENLNRTSSNVCLHQSCPPHYEFVPASPAGHCFCAAPLLVGYRLKSPGFTKFLPYNDKFGHYISDALNLTISQFDIDSVAWQSGPRLGMYLKIFPADINKSIKLFNRSEVLRIRGLFGGWNIHGNEVFGPFELLNFTLLKPYKDEISSSSSGITKGALAGIILGTAAGSVILSAVVFLVFVRSHLRRQRTDSRRRLSSRTSIKIDGVKDFTYSEMEVATNNFNSSTFVGKGGYGKVYKGVLADGTIVAIKRAQEGSLQGEKEFLTEIELLSRLHHRNLVSLVGYCDEEGEQMLIYEFMSNGNLRDHLSGKLKVHLTFAMRLRIALSSAKGILYLHMEANPPIYHRDIKASNILLDPRFTAKVSDFGLSRLAPVPDFEGLVPAHVSTVVKGTPGYLDPEYFLTHKLTDKSDVYSLGVVFLELLTGMHPIYEGKNIVREVNIAYSSGMIFSIIDKRMGSYPSECAVKFIKLALNCCHDDTDTRPSMVEVVRELESISLMMPESDNIISESTLSDAEKVFTPTSSSSTVKTSNVSEDISSSNLLSGVFHTVKPR